MIKIFDFIKRYSIYILIILGFLIYFSTFFYDFVYDDFNLIINNKYLTCRTSINFFDFFIPSFVRDDIYIPFTFIIFWLVIKICGISSFALHFVNVVFYVLSSIVLYYLLKKIINNDSISFFAVILYIIHPCHIECTAWVSAMGYNIASLFFFLSFLFFILAFDESKKLYYICSVVFYILAILSQPIAVTLPIILFLWIYCCRKERLKESIVPIISYLPFLLLFLFIYKKSVLMTGRFAYNHTCLEKIAICGFDIFNSYIPINLCLTHSIPNLYYIIPLIFFIIILYFFRKSLIYIFWGLFEIITILPYSNLFFSIEFPIMDRYLLLSSVSSCVLISYLCFYIFDKLNNKRILKYISFLFFISLYFFSFISYIPIWKNNEVLYSCNYNINPNNIHIQNIYSSFLVNNKQYDNALFIADNMIKNYPMTYEGYNRKIDALIGKGCLNDALQLALKVRKLNLNNYKINICLFNIYISLQNYKEALECLNFAEEEYKNNLLNEKFDSIDELYSKRIILSYINAEPDKVIEYFKIMTDNFKKLEDNGEFIKILNESDYKSREEICLNYLKKYSKNNINYAEKVVFLLSSLYMKENYKDMASNIMHMFFVDINRAISFSKEGNYEYGEKILVSVISRNKYMIQAYYNLGILYLQTNRKEKAREIFDKILEINPYDDKAKAMLKYVK